MTTDPLSAWNEGPTKDAIVAFVLRVTDPNSPEFAAPNERIATFDNDGTLWPEQPMYVQVAFALDRVKELAPDHPEWKNHPVFGPALARDLGALAKTGLKGIAELGFATHAGMTPEEFADIAGQWLATARHPTLDARYPNLGYLPMIQLLDYLRANDFQTFIVSGGGVEFIRVFAEESYGVPPAQVVGSTIRTEFVNEDGKANLRRLPELDFFDDHEGKPVAIGKFIGRRPLIAVGNSDGDLQMLQYTDAQDRPTLKLLLHHDDAEREFAYDKASIFGKLDKALTEAEAKGWTVISMKRDFGQVFAS